MALKAKLDHFDGNVTLDLYPTEQRQWIADDPDSRDWSLYVYADLEKLDQGVYEIVAIEALDVSDITDEWLAALNELDLPLVDVPDAQLSNVSISDVLRWARKMYPSRYSTASV